MAAERLSPYTPSFGMVPHILAGRTDLLDEHVAGLRSGPGNVRFTHALTGDRGVGKTAFLTVLGQRMSGEGWAVLAYQARRERDAVRELLEELPDALRQSWPTRSLRGLQRELSVEVNAGVVKVTGKLIAPASDQRDLVMPLQRALRRVGERAAKRRSGLLVTIDEAQTVPLDALADLGMIIQTVAHRDSLPIAFVFAGTPELGEILLRSGSFLERMPRTELRMLTGEETRLALLEPASAHGVAWSKDALDVVATAAGGYPYFVQVGGERAWRSAHGAATIELVAGRGRRDCDSRTRRSDVPRPLEAARSRTAALPRSRRRKDARRVRPGRAHGRDRGGARQAPNPAITSQSKPDHRASSTARRRLRARRVRIPPLRGLAASAAGGRRSFRRERSGEPREDREDTPGEQVAEAVARTG